MGLKPSREVTEGSSTPGELIRRYRLLSGITQQQLAERIGYSTDYVSKLERGERRAPARVLERVADDLGLGSLERRELLVTEAGTVKFQVPAGDSVSPSSCTLQLSEWPSAVCQVTVTVGRGGTPTVTARYAQTGTELASSATQTLTVGPGAVGNAVSPAARSIQGRTIAADGRAARRDLARRVHRLLKHRPKLPGLRPALRHRGRARR
jgi:transcriptional regulator with XRE-family HTH domain